MTQLLTKLDEFTNLAVKYREERSAIYNQLMEVTKDANRHDEYDPLMKSLKKVDKVFKSKQSKIQNTIQKMMDKQEAKVSKPKALKRKCEFEANDEPPKKKKHNCACPDPDKPCQGKDEKKHGCIGLTCVLNNSQWQWDPHCQKGWLAHFEKYDGHAALKKCRYGEECFSLKRLFNRTFKIEDKVLGPATTTDDLHCHTYTHVCLEDDDCNHNNNNNK